MEPKRKVYVVKSDWAYAQMLDDWRLHALVKAGWDFMIPYWTKEEFIENGDLMIKRAEV